jgi:hypothetical protein
MNGKLQTRQPYSLGLQIPSGVDDEIPIPGTRWRSRAKVPGVVKGNSNQQRNADLCGVDQSRSRAYADWDSATALGIKGGAVSKGKEFAPAVIGIQSIKEAVLGSALMGKRVLGSNEWKCDR